VETYARNLWKTSGKSLLDGSFRGNNAFTDVSKIRHHPRLIRHVPSIDYRRPACKCPIMSDKWHRGWQGFLKPSKTPPRKMGKIRGADALLTSSGRLYSLKSVNSLMKRSSIGIRRSATTSSCFALGTPSGHSSGSHSTNGAISFTRRFPAAIEGGRRISSRPKGLFGFA